MDNNYMNPPPPTVRVIGRAGVKGWTWESKADRERRAERRNEKKRLLKKRRRKDKNAGRK